MKLGEFIQKFSHNNVIRLLYKNKVGEHETVLLNWSDVSMDHEVLSKKGKFRHFINNQVLGLATIAFRYGEVIHHREALNIVIEKLDNQPFVKESECYNKTFSETT